MTAQIVRPFKQWQKTDYTTMLWAAANGFKTQVRGKYPKQTHWVMATEAEINELEKTT